MLLRFGAARWLFLRRRRRLLWLLPWRRLCDGSVGHAALWLGRPDPDVLARVVDEDEPDSWRKNKDKGDRVIDGNLAAAVHFTEVLDSWCGSVESSLMAETDAAQHTEAGPLSELEFWRGR